MIGVCSAAETSLDFSQIYNTLTRTPPSVQLEIPRAVNAYSNKQESDSPPVYIKKFEEGNRSDTMSFTFQNGNQVVVKICDLQEIRYYQSIPHR